MLASISGGTDIISCFALGCPIKPVIRGELQCIGLGMDVAILNEQGQEVIGEKGELVCKSPFPSMPVYFYNDSEGQKYSDAYFSRDPSIWAHGDFAKITREGGVMILGRSDAILNPGGVRIGTAEIYRQVEKIPEVIDSVVIGQDHQDDVRVILFVRLKQGLKLDECLITTIKQTIRSNTTPRHVPRLILQVQDIPKTVSGKTVELAVKNIVEGRSINNLEAIANPKALDEFSNREELYK
jgi:acetoacetyl-CoA synthetase